MKVRIQIITCLFLVLSCGGCKRKYIPRKEVSEKPIVVVIPSFNNAPWCKRNLQSVFDQHYTNYRIIYLNDCSTDSTYTQVVDYIRYKQQQNRTTVINNPTRAGSLANLYQAIHSCADHEIIVQLDGDDWLAHNKVFKKINYLYSTKKIWATYGSFKNWPIGTRGFCQHIASDIVSHNAFRSCDEFFAGALRTFYAWLFKKIKKEDLIDTQPPYEGSFYQAAGDVAYMLPLLEMAGERFYFVKNILCIRNVQTPLNDFKVNSDLQDRITKEIQQKKSYQRLT